MALISRMNLEVGKGVKAEKEIKPGHAHGLPFAHVAALFPESADRLVTADALQLHI